jgi:hypothetical protein
MREAYRQVVLLVADVAVRAALQQEVHDLHVAAHGGPVQRGVVTLARERSVNDDAAGVIVLLTWQGAPGPGC